ncbi:importin-11 isoform X1 [Silurus meridionalis]|nr:importin-11 isoform X1 [Silurus meridionalis]
MLASSIYSFACSLWNHHTDMFLLKIQSRDPHTALSALEHTLLSLKVLRKLTVNGFVEPHQNMEVMGFLGAVFDRSKVKVAMWAELMPAEKNWRRSSSSTLKWYTTLIHFYTHTHHITRILKLLAQCSKCEGYVKDIDLRE